MKIRDLERHELEDIWSIDRAEVIENVYYRERDELVLKPEYHDMPGWPPGEPEHYGPILLDCFDRDGTCYGAFDRDALIGAAVLESRFIGHPKDQLQLKFLHVSRAHRRTGLGRTLFEMAAQRARELGARRLYISSTPSENTVQFYLRNGCRMADHVDTGLFELEPEDIHLECDIAMMRTMDADAVLEILTALESAGVQVWLDGGWGVDALLGEQTRDHADLDIILAASDVPALKGVLGAIGFRVKPEGNASNFVLADALGREVDAHPIVFDHRGTGFFEVGDGRRWPFPAAAFAGEGRVRGRRVQCLSADAQVQCHGQGYEPTENDLRDMERLQVRFGVVLPLSLCRQSS